MFLVNLIIRFSLLKKLRLALTLLAIAAAISAFGLMQSVISAWRDGGGVPAAMRLVTYHAASLANTLPLAYRDKIARVDGVVATTHVQWFNGSFRDSREFFPKFAVDAPGYLAVYPEIHLSDMERMAFLEDRAGCLIGARLARRFALKIGDRVILRGAKYDGLWQFTVRGVFESDVAQQEWQMLFHWAYLNETIRQVSPLPADQVGAYVVRIADAASACAIAARIDQLFINAPDATRTESENTFQLGFLYSTGALLSMFDALSLLVLLIILLIVSNTMLMSARERYREYATLKAIGFDTRFIAATILGESVLIASSGGVLGMLATFPLARAFEVLSGGLVPVVSVGGATMAWQMAMSLLVGVAAGVFPSWMVARRRVVESLRDIG